MAFISFAIFLTFVLCFFEQHIEDLTQEKFSLQRALEASRVLAESLATENSALTDTYNQQVKTSTDLNKKCYLIYCLLIYLLHYIHLLRREALSTN